MGGGGLKGVSSATEGVSTGTMEPVGPDYSSISASKALISPNEAQFELILQRVRDLMEEGRGQSTTVILIDFKLTLYSIAGPIFPILAFY